MSFFQTSSDTPGIQRVKLTASLDDITQNGIFGKVATSVCVVEFQKRGHILDILTNYWKIIET
ncbi:LOW QUALITY PROTEIN: hypothetical protein PHMEG_0006863 [Phytophthora megakarya]|uniref:Uncharacterized protein n=1 Tax=Phytophthora megakarya TaxID=4795 RepID=A0A225WQ16_9STRA|nr:LOW QUALITY PROTEIN: hypothetical protein PHMEG_0006863 [Phytophthora megakarya]